MAVLRRTNKEVPIASRISFRDKQWEVKDDKIINFPDDLTAADKELLGAYGFQLEPAAEVRSSSKQEEKKVDIH